MEGLNLVSKARLMKLATLENIQNRNYVLLVKNIKLKDIVSRTGSLNYLNLLMNNKTRIGHLSSVEFAGLRNFIDRTLYDKINSVVFVNVNQNIFDHCAFSTKLEINDKFVEIHSICSKVLRAATQLVMLKQ